jgi:hypothetical protein
MGDRIAELEAAVIEEQRLSALKCRSLSEQLEQVKLVGYRNLERAQELQIQLKSACSEIEFLRGMVQAALDWYGLDGDGISDPVRQQLIDALAAEKPSEPGRELFESYRTNNPERLIAVALWKSWEEQSREVKDEWNAKALAAAKPAEPLYCDCREFVQAAHGDYCCLCGYPKKPAETKEEVSNG